MTLDGAGLDFIAAHEQGPVGDQAGIFSETTERTDRRVRRHSLYQSRRQRGDWIWTSPSRWSRRRRRPRDYPSPIDQTQADALLSADTTAAVDAVNNDVKVVLTQDRVRCDGRLHV